MGRSLLDRLLPRGSAGMRRIALAEVLGPRVGARGPERAGGRPAGAPGPASKQRTREGIDEDDVTEPPDGGREG